MIEDGFWANFWRVEYNMEDWSGDWIVCDRWLKSAWENGAEYSSKDAATRPSTCRACWNTVWHVSCQGNCTTLFDCIYIADEPYWISVFLAVVDALCFDHWAYCWFARPTLSNVWGMMDICLTDQLLSPWERKICQNTEGALGSTPWSASWR